MQAVIDRDLNGRAAALPGYAAFQVRRAAYPGIVRIPGHTTAGLVYCNLTPAELAILDRFEGRLYKRRRLTVHTRDGRRRGAWVYLVRPGHNNRLTPRLWRRREFMQHRLRRFMQRFVQDRRPVFDPQAR